MNAESQSDLISGPTALTVGQAFAQAASFHQAGRLQEAERLYKAILVAQPQHGDANCGMGVLATQMGQPQAGIAYFKAAVQYNLGKIEFWACYISALIEAGDSLAARNVLEQGWQRGLRGDAIDALARRLESQLGPTPSDMGAQLSAMEMSKAINALNYRSEHTGETIFRNAKRYGELVAKRAKRYTEWENSPDPERRLRIGLVSGDIGEHAVGFFVHDLLKEIAQQKPEQIEFVAYLSRERMDSLARQQLSWCRSYRKVEYLTDEQFARQVRADGIDILVDLSGHTLHNRLPVFAWKAAPIQVTYLGYPGTTGLEEIDYRLTDHYTEPEGSGADAWYTEKLVRLPDSLWCYGKLEVAIEVNELPALKNGYVTFGSFNNANKLNDGCIEVWSAILRRLPEARLLMVAVPESQLRGKLTEQFQVRGIETHRISYVDCLPTEEFKRKFQEIDISLDPFPVNGATTTCESLWMGVPVVSMEGARFVSRAGLSILSNAGLRDWVAKDKADYVEKAVANAADITKLAALRRGLRHQVLASPLFDGKRFARNFGQALRTMWQTWCAQQSGTLVPSRHEIEGVVGNYRSGAFEETTWLAKRLTERFPAHPIGWQMLGAALGSLERNTEALEPMRRAMELAPDDASQHNNLGNILHKLGQTEAAVESFRRALAIEPKFAEAYNNLGSVFNDRHQYEVALDCYRQALAIKPNYAEAHRNMGKALQGLAQFDAAEECYRRALAIKPDYASAYVDWGIVERERGNIHRALEYFRTAFDVDQNCYLALNNYLYTSVYLPEKMEEQAFGLARRYGAVVAAKAKQFTTWENDRDPERCLKVGLVTGDFGEHAVGYFMENLLTTLAMQKPKRIEAVAYVSHARKDAAATRLQACCLAWREMEHTSDERFAQQIRADGIDILIDLSGHTRHNRLPLFAWKSAPVQVTYLGYPGTTGLEEVDYRLTDQYTEPEESGADANYTEKLVRLADSVWCYRKPQEAIEVNELPAIKNGYITFGSFNNANKLNDDSVEVWSAILKRLPKSRLLMVTVAEGPLRTKLKGQFQAQGIEAGRISYCDFLPPEEFKRKFQEIDISLDPFPVNGATTTCESLWMGVPVVSLEGEGFAGRAGLSILSNAGLRDWVAKDRGEYVEKAVVSATDISGLAALRQSLRPQVLASPIFDGTRFAEGFEHALRGMWRTWCEQRKRQP